MEADLKAFPDRSLWGSLVDCVECGETFLWKLLIAVRKNNVIVPSIRVTGMFLS